MNRPTVVAVFGRYLQELLELLLKYGVVVAVEQDIPAATAVRSQSAAQAATTEYVQLLHSLDVSILFVQAVRGHVLHRTLVQPVWDADRSLLVLI